MWIHRCYLMDDVWIRQIWEVIAAMLIPRYQSLDLQTKPQLGQEAPGEKEVLHNTNFKLVCSIW